MATSDPVPPTAAAKPRASLPALFRGFLSIGLSSFGGGLAAWIRREVVERRGWLDDRQFLTGYALSQLVPGATNVNLAVFIGAQLRGAPGVLAALAGLMLVPTGADHRHRHAVPARPGDAWLELDRHGADRHGRGRDRPQSRHRRAARPAQPARASARRW